MKDFHTKNQHFQNLKFLPGSAKFCIQTNIVLSYNFMISSTLDGNTLKLFMKFLCPAICRALVGRNPTRFL